MADNPKLDPETIKDAIRKQAIEIGFDSVGFARAETNPEDARALTELLEKNWQGDMDWLDNANGRRGIPKALMPAVNTVIVLGTNYGSHLDPLANVGRADRGSISVYARGKDYHDLVKKRLKQLARWIIAEYGGDLKVFVDTAPVMEKPLAARSSLGWQGKHTNLVSREFGSWLFLGEVFTTLDLPADPPEIDHCGKCHKCLDVCPTDAFDGAYRLIATRCISYLTIEHKGMIDEELMEKMGNRIYGCDDCLSVCPWNKFASPTREASFFPRIELTAPRLRELALLDDADFRKFFTASPIKRTGRDRFVRNVLIAIGNSQDPSLLETAENLLNDDSPIVAGTALWAKQKLLACLSPEML